MASKEILAWKDLTALKPIVFEGKGIIKVCSYLFLTKMPCYITEVV